MHCDEGRRKELGARINMYNQKKNKLGKKTFHFLAQIDQVANINNSGRKT
jgi:hypothetical protein